MRRAKARRFVFGSEEGQFEWTLLGVIPKARILTSGPTDLAWIIMVLRARFLAPSEKRLCSG